MPKQKTHSGAKKRFKLTGTGKLMKQQAGMRHNLEVKSSKRKRRLNAEQVRSMLSSFRSGTARGRQAAESSGPSGVPATVPDGRGADGAAALTPAEIPDPTGSSPQSW